MSKKKRTIPGDDWPIKADIHYLFQAPDGGRPVYEEREQGAPIQEAERAEQEDAIQYTEDEECEYRRVMDSLEQQGFGFNPAQRKKT